MVPNGWSRHVIRYCCPLSQISTCSKWLTYTWYVTNKFTWELVFKANLWDLDGQYVRFIAGCCGYVARWKQTEEPVRVVLLYKRYTNGILVVAHLGEQAYGILDKLCLLPRNISFIFEGKMNKTLSILEVMIVRRTDGLISSSVCRKSAWMS